MLFLFEDELKKVLTLAGQDKEAHIEELMALDKAEVQLVLEMVTSLGQTWCTVTFGEPAAATAHYYVSYLGLQKVS